MPADPSATLLVNGMWQSAAATFDVTDPATLKVIAQAADAGPQEALAALDAADAAAESWRRTTAEERSAALRAGAGRIRTQADSLAALMTSENGKPLGEARGEVLGSARMLEWAAEEARRANGRVAPDGAAGPGMVLRTPVGPALAITPWNFPASMLVRKVGLALAAGCPVIVKPAEQTPLIGTELVRLIAEAGALPPGCSSRSPRPVRPRSRARCSPTAGSARSASPAPPRSG